MNQSPSISPLRGGTVVYQTTLVRAGDETPESFELATLRHNLALSRTVQFGDGNARTDEVNADCGVRSPCVRLQRADRDTTLYGKMLHRVRFGIALPPRPELGGREGVPVLAPDGEPCVVAGWHCRRALYVDGARRLAIAYTDDLAVEDPTHAVMQLPGVPGMVMAWEELPRDARSAWWIRVAVSVLTPAAPDPGQFVLPDGYRRFANVDEARAEDRRLLDAEAEAEQHAAPLTAAEQQMFVGRWRWDHGDAELDIAAAGLPVHRVRTVASTGPRDDVAVQQSRRLLVEDPPNCRIYQLDDHGHLVLSDDDTFRFHRV